MATDLVIDDHLIADVLAVGEQETKEAAVTEALKEYIRRREQGNKMPARIFVADTLAHGRDICELEQAVKEGLAIRDYLNAEISMGEFAELMGMEYVEARDWLHSQGILTTRRLPRTLKHISEKNQEKLAQELGI